MLFWLGQTSPKAWLCHLPSFWAFWMIHNGPWEWMNNRSHDGNTSACAVMACPHMHALMSWGSGPAFDSAGDGAFPAKTLQDLSDFHCNAIFFLLFLGTSHIRTWSADPANSLHLHKSQARRETPGLWWVHECCQAEQEWVSGVTERSDPTYFRVVTSSTSTEKILKHWESEIKCAIY